MRGSGAGIISDLGSDAEEEAGELAPGVGLVALLVARRGARSPAELGVAGLDPDVSGNGLGDLLPRGDLGPSRLQLAKGFGHVDDLAGVVSVLELVVEVAVSGPA